MTCTQYVGGLTLCAPSSWKVFSRTPDRVRWCFGCRAHLAHDFILEGEDGETYYGPNWRYDCSRCGRDRVLGFGQVWADPVETDGNEE